MFVHPYHFQLVRCLIRKKVKGDHHIPLTCADRESLADSLNLSVSKSKMVKVLREKGHEHRSLSQHTMDQLVRYVGYSDWNDFLRKNPVPDGKYYDLQKLKARKLLEELVEKRMGEMD